MRASRIICTRVGGGSHRNSSLLPQPSTFDTATCALKGWWSILVDQSARDAYEEAVQKNIIKDVVLESASHGGALLIYSLFHNLRNPLLEKHNFDAHEFVEGVGPALEHFRDTLELLRNDMVNANRKEKQDESIIAGNNDEEVENPFALLGLNRWREEADRDENSLAGRLSKMVTDVCFESFYFTTKVDLLAQATSLNSAVYSYVPKSVTVNDVAIMNVRALPLDAETYAPRDDTAISPEQRSNYESPGVAAQVDVLFEMTHKLRKTPSGEDSKSTSTEGSNAEGSVMTFTNLGVAVFEGWLYNPTSTEGLRWKISRFRDAFEFPEYQPTIRNGQT